MWHLSCVLFRFLGFNLWSRKRFKLRRQTGSRCVYVIITHNTPVKTSGALMAENSSQLLQVGVSNYETQHTCRLGSSDSVSDIFGPSVSTFSWSEDRDYQLDVINPMFSCLIFCLLTSNCSRQPRTSKWWVIRFQSVYVYVWVSLCLSANNKFNEQLDRFQWNSENNN